MKQDRLALVIITILIIILGGYLFYPLITKNLNSRNISKVGQSPSITWPLDLSESFGLSDRKMIISALRRALPAQDSITESYAVIHGERWTDDWGTIDMVAKDAFGEVVPTEPPFIIVKRIDNQWVVYPAGFEGFCDVLGEDPDSLRNSIGNYFNCS